MIRTFTKDVGTRFKKGDVQDYAKPVWDQIAKSAPGGSKKKPAALDSFSVAGADTVEKPSKPTKTDPAAAATT